MDKEEKQYLEAVEDIGPSEAINIIYEHATAFLESLKRHRENFAEFLKHVSTTELKTKKDVLQILDSSIEKLEKTDQMIRGGAILTFFISHDSRPEYTKCKRSKELPVLAEQIKNIVLEIQKIRVELETILEVMLDKNPTGIAEVFVSATRSAIDKNKLTPKETLGQRMAEVSLITNLGLRPDRQRGTMLSARRDPSLVHIFSGT